MMKDLPVEKVFLFISLIFGFLYVLILPPFQSVDEASHFYRGYEIISGKPVAQKINGQVGDYLPESLNVLSSKYDFLIKDINQKTDLTYILGTEKIKLNKNNLKFTEFGNTALYSPLCYISQIPGMYLAKSFNVNPLIMLYFGRISNLLCFILIVYFAIKTIPFYKFPMMLLAVMPMTLSLAGSLTSDVMVIGFNFLWITLLLRVIFQKSQISNLQIIYLILCAFILVFLKHYFMLIPLIFLIPKSKFSNWHKYFACILGVLIFSLAGILIWQYSINNLVFNMNTNANLSPQLNFILSNPFSYLLVLLKTFIIKTPRLIITMIGVLGWQDTRLDFLTYIIYPVLIGLSILLESNTEFIFKKWQIYLLSLDSILFVIVIFTEIYITSTGIGFPIVYGLNGKYFIPLMLPFLLLFKSQKNYFENKNMIKFLICFLLILILISSDLSILHRFYGLTPNLYYMV